MIHALMVSVNYADFLAHTLPELQRVVDGVTVITSWEDIETYIVASEHGVNVCRTDAFRHNFCKGAAINEALACRPFEKDCWLLHVDADIAVLDKIHTDRLDKTVLYGAQRYSVIGRRCWRSTKHKHEAWKKMRPCPQDAPFTKERYRLKHSIKKRRALPPGFFQLWHSSSFRDYPHESLDASLDDILHAERFAKTAILPNFGVYHLESEDHDLKANWQGRRTGLF